MEKIDMENQILSVFPSAKKIDFKSHNIFHTTNDKYMIDKETELYLFNTSDWFKIGILCNIKRTYLINSAYWDEIYVDFKYKNDSKLIDDESTWSSKLEEKVKFYSFAEILNYLKKEWEELQNGILKNE